MESQAHLKMAQQEAINITKATAEEVSKGPPQNNKIQS